MCFRFQFSCFFRLCTYIFFKYIVFQNLILIFYSRFLPHYSLLYSLLLHPRPYPSFKSYYSFLMLFSTFSSTIFPAKQSSIYSFPLSLLFSLTPSFLAFYSFLSYVLNLCFLCIFPCLFISLSLLPIYLFLLPRYLPFLFPLYISLSIPSPSLYLFFPFPSLSLSLLPLYLLLSFPSPSLSLIPFLLCSRPLSLSFPSSPHFAEISARCRPAGNANAQHGSLNCSSVKLPLKLTSICSRLLGYNSFYIMFSYFSSFAFFS